MPKLEEVLRYSKAVKFEGNICILASLVMRDVYRRLGFKAEVKSVALQLQATAHEADIPLHVLGVGLNKIWGEPYLGKDWDGHLVVSIEGHIVDPTFYCMRRKAWDWLPDVAVVKREQPITRRLFNLPVIGRLYQEVPEHNYKFEAQWVAYSANKGWMNSPDYRYPMRRKQGADDVLAALAEHGLT